MTITTSIIVIVTITIIVTIIGTIIIDTIIDKHYCYHNYFNYVHYCYYYSSGRYDGPFPLPYYPKPGSRGLELRFFCILWAVTTLW